MAYVKTVWKNRIVERPRTFRQQQNADGTVTLIPEEGQIIEPGTPVNAQNLNNIDDAVSTHLVDYLSHLANGGTTAGTATAYTCNSSPNPQSLVDKIGIVITAHVDSGVNPTLKWGSLTAKSIKKPNGSAASLKKDGLYTLRYNSVNDSFILQGEGGEYGNVIASDIRIGKTFGTENGVTNGTLDLSKLIPQNIKSGVTIDGKIGTLTELGAGDTIVYPMSQYSNIFTKTPTSSLDLRMPFSTTYRIKFDMGQASASDPGYAQIYVDGVAKGIKRTHANPSTQVTYTEDIYVPANGILSLYGWQPTNENGYLALGRLTVGITSVPIIKTGGA